MNLTHPIFSNLQPILQPNLQPILLPNLQHILQPNLQPNLQTNLQHILQRNLQPILQPNLQPILQPNLKPNLQPNLHPSPYLPYANLCANPAQTVQLKYLQQHILKLRYCKWFEDNAKNRVGVRVSVAHCTIQGSYAAKNCTVFTIHLLSKAISAYTHTHRV